MKRYNTRGFGLLRCPHTQRTYLRASGFIEFSLICYSNLPLLWKSRTDAPRRQWRKAQGSSSSYESEKRIERESAGSSKSIGSAKSVGSAKSGVSSGTNKSGGLLRSNSTSLQGSGGLQNSGGLRSSSDLGKIGSNNNTSSNNNTDNNNNNGARMLRTVSEKGIREWKRTSTTTARDEIRVAPYKV